MRDVLCRNSSCTTFDVLTIRFEDGREGVAKVCHEFFLVIPGFRAAGWMISLITALSQTGCFPRFAPARFAAVAHT